jgi:hypothetical protein
VFERVANEAVKRKHKIRWFTTTEVVGQAIRKAAVWPDVVAELEKENLCKETLPKLKKLVVDNARAYDELWIQMSAVYDATKHFYTATTFFEGTSFRSVCLAVHADVALGGGEDSCQRGAEHGAAKCRRDTPRVSAACQHAAFVGRSPQNGRPGLEYFLGHFVRFEKDSKARAFKAANDLFGFARLFHPVYAKEWIAGSEAGTPALTLRDQLANPVILDVLQVLGQNIAQELTADFGRFITCVEQRVEPGKKYRPDDVIEWWKTNGSDTGSWAAAARLFSLLQPRRLQQSECSRCCVRALASSRN